MVQRFLLSILIGLASAVPALAAERSPSRLDLKRVMVIAAMARECQASEEALALARAEATAVWSRADVTVRWVAQSELPYESPRTDWLLVRCVDGEAPSAESETRRNLAIATIWFVSSRPTNTIVVNVSNAERLLRQDAAVGQDRRAWWQPYREGRLGRMLGRAVAHEIGHFITRSSAHTPGGLMRATHSVAALTGASRAPFAVQQAHLRTLESPAPAAPVSQY